MKQVIVLERLDETRLVFRYALWAAVPVGRETYYANPSATSAYKEATGPELAALQAGQVVERVGAISLPPGIGLAAAQTELQAIWQRYQDEINATNTFQRYGSSWDGVSWTLAGA